MERIEEQYGGTVEERSIISQRGNEENKNTAEKNFNTVYVREKLFIAF